MHKVLCFRWLLLYTKRFTRVVMSVAHRVMRGIGRELGFLSKQSLFCDSGTCSGTWTDIEAASIQFP